MMNDSTTQITFEQENSSSTFVLELNEEDMMNDAAIPITSPQENNSSTVVLETNDDDMMDDAATENVTQNNETIVVSFKLSALVFYPSIFLLTIEIYVLTNNV